MMRKPAAQVESSYAGLDDPDFAAILMGVVAGDDDAVAEAIEMDGRKRIMAGQKVDLKRYLDGVPALATRETALDAAIDVTLRFRSRGPRPTARAVQSLIADYPLLQDAISEAALLAEAVVSTSGVGRIMRPAPARALPAEFGPVMTDGRSRYQLTFLLGSGSSGEVYQAIDRQLSEPDRPAYVAIKLLAGRGRSDRARQLLADEATKARRVLHDHVVRVLDRGVSNQDEDYIVYEHIQGGDLDAWFEERAWTLTAREAAGVVARIARGVQAAHSAGVFHCDLKPSNILITETGEPKVCDFGIAVREGEARSGAAGDGPVGNIAFISPEQFRREEGSFSPPSDVYALGGILYYLLTHRYPNGESIDQVGQTHALVGGREAPPSARALRTYVDPDLDAVCRRAMAVRPADRYASAAAFADDLESWARREPIRWLRPSPWKIARLAARRRPAVAVSWAIALAAVIAGAAGAGYWASRANRVDTRNQVAKSILGGLLTWMESLQGNRRDEDVLPMLTAVESLFGAAVFGTPENQARAWELRIGIVRTMVAEADAAGRGSDTETIMWQSLLGLWLLNADQLDEAERTLKDNVARWHSRGLSGDCLPKQMEAVLATATARRILKSDPERPMSPEAMMELSALDPFFRTEAEVFVGRAALNPLRRPVLDTIIEVYGPKMLKDKSLVRRANRARSKMD